MNEQQSNDLERALLNAAGMIADAFTPRGVLPAIMENGTRVDSIVEALVYIGQGLFDVADAIREHG